MNLSPHLSVRGGHLYVGEHDTVRLAAEFGTPLYVTDEERVRARYREYRDALTAHYDPVQVLYAAKANGNPALLRVLAGEGAGADVFSPGELELALRAGMDPSRLLFNGSSKSREDLRLAVERRIRVSLDSPDELDAIDQVAEALGQTALVAFRVNPALDVPTHPKIATGLASSKFGIPHAAIPDAYRAALRKEHVRPVGIHCHIGSQILALEPFVEAARVMVRIAGELVRLGVELEFIDLGGGLGIPYRHGVDRAPSPREYADAVMPVFVDGVRELGIRPALWVEPGRSIVADSTVLLTRVNSTKDADRRFVNVDAGFNQLIRPAMYGAYHEVVVANRADAPAESTCTVAGPICESGDLLAEDRALPAVREGDLLAILDAGAYGFAMSSQYNARPRAAELLVRGPDRALMRRAETIDDLVATHSMPPWL
ncbi:MAG TPA: diaminopimelate decarboxylase [Methanoregulaceae archaeon]|nr:diaminopimelate decarboxylase [Methanoregulaceae archaeon]HQJ87642.1 diaminopimelate decarboxylase [Methanoregulaceae archaeon]